MINIEDQRKERAMQLRVLRKSTGLTQSELYDISGVSTKTISKIERGLVAWSIDTELILITCLNKHLNVA